VRSASSDYHSPMANSESSALPAIEVPTGGQLFDFADPDPSVVAASEVRSMLDSYLPIVGILSLASGLFQIAGLTNPQAPALTGGIDRGALTADQSTVIAFTTALHQ
jgi:hypothetical protein